MEYEIDFYACPICQELHPADEQMTDNFIDIGEWWEGRMK